MFCTVVLECDLLFGVWVWFSCVVLWLVFGCSGCFFIKLLLLGLWEFVFYCGCSLVFVDLCG